MSEIEPLNPVDVNDLVRERREKLNAWRAQGTAYPNDWKPSHFAKDLHAQLGELSHEAIEAEAMTVTVCGRILTRRVMGKASFVTLQDMSGKIQLYIQLQNVSEAVYHQATRWDLGDIIGVRGVMFKTKTQELSIKVQDMSLLSKALYPLPDKFHGLVDKEACYRQRYLDLIMNEETRHRFQVRSKVIQTIRQFLNERAFLEVETPMMHPLPGGAAARPFETHYNALDCTMFLRIAPELYLKRLVVGGFERVYEINRSFRNEGLSTRHNPEFTMIEFYQAYADYKDLIVLTQELFKLLCQTVCGTLTIPYQGQVLDFGKPFQIWTVAEAILHYNSKLTADMLQDTKVMTQYVTNLGVTVSEQWGLGKLWIEVFEATVEHQLFQPTFVIDYPLEVSPLARKKEGNPFLCDRFELFIGGRELANGFSELNDPEDQAERFKQQVALKDAGDGEAMFFDADYVHALEYGLPPTAGEGIGIDRLVMLLTDTASIRDVILFPMLKEKEARES